MICESCGRPRANDGAPFCAGCGTPFAAPALAVPQPNASLALPGAGGTPIGYVGRMQSLPAGPVCPVCFSRVFANHYTVWHLIVAAIFFPFGVLSLLAPVRICQNGHRYGVGLAIVRFIQVLLAICVVLGAILAWVLVGAVHALERVL